jgi:hypothetical protein
VHRPHGREEFSQKVLEAELESLVAIDLAFLIEVVALDLEAHGSLRDRGWDSQLAEFLKKRYGQLTYAQFAWKLG